MASGRFPRPRAGDLVAGLSVAMLVVPQSIGLAAPAGLPPEQGVYAAALAPLITAFTSSSPFLQSGPTALTSLLTLGALSAIAMPFAPPYVALASLLALEVGLIRLAIGRLRIGAVAYLMSQPVVAGFTAAGAVIIVLTQVPAALGMTGDASEPVLSAFRALTGPGAWDRTSAALAVGTAALVLLGRRLHPLFPGVLIAAVGGILLVQGGAIDVPVVGDVRAGFPILGLALPWRSASSLVLPAIAIALVGFAEPAAVARHYATRDRTPWDPNREFTSQGLANIVTGIAGSYPVGGSFSRSALNRLAGAQTRWSGMVTALTVLAFLPFLSAISPLPRAIMAAIVMSAVVSLLNPAPFLEYRRLARAQFGVAIATFAATLALAPRVDEGVLIGIGIGIGAHLWREVRIPTGERVEGDVLHIEPHGVLFFASAPALQDEVNALVARHPDIRRLVLHLGGLGRIDLTGALALRDLVTGAQAAGIEVELVDVPPQAAKVVERTLAAAPGVAWVAEDASNLRRRAIAPRREGGEPPSRRGS